MKKRILSILLVYCIVFSMFPTLATAVSDTDVAYAVEGGNIYVDLTTGAITGADQTVTRADIPVSIDGVYITSIRGEAFAKTGLTSIVLPDNEALYVGPGVFNRCENLSSIIIPKSVTQFATSGMFATIIPDPSDSPNIVTAGPIGGNYNIQFGWKNQIPSYAFSECLSLKSVVIPDGITDISDFAFFYCSGIEHIIIPDGVTNIGRSAFFECRSLQSIIIPDSINSIGDYAFDYCKSLSEVYYGGSENQWNTIDIAEGNSLLTSATIHFNSTGPDDNPDESASSTSVRYFSEWDAANQIAYFGEDTLHLSSAVTDETDTSFLADVDNLVGSYVLAETRSRDDDLIGPNILLSIKPVETKAGTVTAVDDSSITIDGVSYLLPEGWLFAEAYEGKRVIYHLNEGNLVGIEELETLTGTLKSWNAETGRITIDPDGLDDVTTYTLSPLADEETISVLEQNKGQNADVKYVKDSMSFIYQVRLVENSGGDKAPFELGKDNFRFVNSPNDFLTDSEYEKWKQVHGKEATFVEELRKEGIYSPTQISQEAFDRLTLGLSNSAKQYISEFKDSVWGGSCYGMSTAMAIRYIDANRLPIEYILPNNSANIKTTNELFAPKESDGVEDLINYYQLMYRYPYILSLEKYYESLAKKDYTEAVYNLVNEIKNDDVPVVACILDYSPEPSPEDGTDFSVLSAHAVILLDVVDNDESFYTATVYDPNFSESFGTMLIYKNIQEERKFDSIQIKYVSGGNSSEQSRVYDCLYNYTASIEEMDIRNLYGLAKDNTYLNNYDSPVLVVPIDEDIVFSSESSSLTYQLGTIVEKSNIYGPFSDIGALIVGDSVGNLTFMLDSFDDENYSFDISSHSASSSAGIILEDFYVEFMSTHDMHVELNNNQTLSIKSDQPSMISTMVTINKTSEKWPWYTVAIDVSDATELTLALVKDSIEISSDNFQNAAIAAKNDDKIVFEDIDVDAATVQLVNREDGIAVRPIELSHTTTFVPAVAATCKETGTVAHWHCSVCDKDFADSEGAVELVDVVIPVDPANHVGGTELRNVKAATYTEEGYTGDTYCLGCGAKIADGTVIPKKTQSSGGGSNGASAYVIAIDSAKYGDVTSSHKSATKGTTITLTVNPDKGYTLETLTVTDENGAKVNITEKNGKYTFIMPASKVTVKATFMEDNSMLNFFVDVPVDAYYYDAVLWAAENGITGGTSDTTFSPNAHCTRAQIVTFLWRAAGSPVVNDAMNFTDVPADAYYAEAVRWAVSLGITTGTGNGMFSPDATCTRAQAMTFIYRSVQAQGGGMQGAWMFQNPFEDVHLENYYGEAVMWAVANGITSGTSDTTFSPNNDCTRAQIVTFLYRSMK